MEIGKVYFAVYRVNCGVTYDSPYLNPIVFNNLIYITADEEAAKKDKSVFCGYVKIMMVEGDGKFIIKEIP